MKLYHGTSAAHLNSIMANGLRGRGRRKGNWKHTVLAHPEGVYLTDAYAPYFAVQAAKDGESLMIVEVDTERMFALGWLVPDEDFLGQLNPHKLAEPDLKRRTEQYREKLPEFIDTDAWLASLRAMGTCAHLTVLDPAAISRIAIIKPEHKVSTLLNWDASISMGNYRFLAARYRAQTARLFGDTPANAPDTSVLSMTGQWQIPVSADILTVTMGQVESIARVELPDERMTGEEFMKRIAEAADQPGQFLL